ncbi:MAG: M42 family metallopeptidase [Bacteroidia bacterium]|nr:M42 family metallopeptidase [Bacteroidia bacterium]
MSLNIPLLKTICETPGAPGHEERVRKLVLQEIEGLADHIEIDNLGNLIALKKGKSDKKVMVAAHMDEISFIVTHIDDDGFARFHTLGGFDPKTLTAQRVIVHGKQDIIGVMGSKPIHIMDPADRNKAPKISDYFIDFGMEAKKVKEIVSVGDVVTRERSLIEMGDCVNSKSLDNRLSVYILIEALRRIRQPAFDLYAVFTVQEEIGIRGAKVAAHRINPDFGFGLDVTIAFDLPDASAHEKITSLGKGTAIKIMDSSVISDPRMVKFMRETAEKHKIPYQNEILTGGGTDTAAIQREGKYGSISGCISIPTRHIHSVIEMAHKDDIQHSIDLLVACLEDLDQGDFSRK